MDIPGRNATLNIVMGIAIINLKRTVAAIFVTVMFSASSMAQEADSRDEVVLLAQLAQSTPEQAIGIDRQLKALWSQSGSASADLLLERGREALDDGDTLTAIEHLTALTDHAPDFAEGWNMRASAFFGMDRFGMAAADLEHALTLNPNNYEAIFGLGLIFEIIEQPGKALDAYERALAIHPHHEEVTNAVNRLKPQVEGSTL
ncbi:putative PEP-CTERM system TPR-repeat lipoprotein [Ruegeria denitrificans]|uniref:Putative PEP-CTERM system TPR-repeat lipoprotein n=1 Tax=Ruegeria denitrificans TaxID=1715692 RepID=A0A0N7M8X9_9RHOB|nr:tetratricopeptide repeat protein [Ruegeria denitrificans]CUJ92256.1 putative PEP-CTERM system TPR-repeat lipoprotein [Ruegeria denitrificans]